MKKMCTVGLMTIILAVLLLTGCAGKTKTYQVYKMSVTAPADMDADQYVKAEEGYLPSESVVLSVDDTDQDEWPEVIFHLQVNEMEMTEERYGDQLNGMDVNTYFQTQEGVVERIVEGNKRGAGEPKDVNSSIRDMGQGITGLQVDFVDVDCGGKDRHRRILEFYYEGNLYHVLSYWVPEKTALVDQLFDSLKLA